MPLPRSGPYGHYGSAMGPCRCRSRAQASRHPHQRRLGRILALSPAAGTCTQLPRGEGRRLITSAQDEPHPLETLTVVNRQYAAELAVVAAARAFAGAATRDSEAVADAATDALMELAR